MILINFQYSISLTFVDLSVFDSSKQLISQGYLNPNTLSLVCSHPFKPGKNGIGITDHFPIIKDKSIIFSVVRWHVNSFDLVTQKFCQSKDLEQNSKKRIF
jgi:hypothetical protein